MPKDLYQSKKTVSGLGMIYEKIDAVKKLHVVLEGAQGKHRMYALQYVQIHEGDKRRWSICHHKSGDQTTSLHIYYTKAKTVVSV
jgi:hypothetical protein